MAAGLLFRWTAHVLAGVCALIDAERAGRPALIAAADKLAGIEALVAEREASCASAREVADEAEQQQRQHAASERLQQNLSPAEETEVLAFLADDSGVAAAKAKVRGLDPVAREAAKAKARAKAADGAMSVEDVVDEEDEETMTHAERKAKALTDFQRQEKEKAALIRRRAIEEAGSLLG